MKYKKLSIFLTISFVVFSLLIITFSAIINIYEKRKKIADFVNTKIKKEAPADYDNIKEDIYWANEILNGGYILHFRHAERDKWIDVQMYDALESDVHENGINESRYAEKDYFKNAVCLNERGLIQAKAMGEHLKVIGLPIGNVYSSVSCRSRQTAELAFGGYDSLHRILVHKGPYNEDKENRLENLKRFYSEIQIDKNTNAIVSAHNSVIDCKMFVNDKCPIHLTLEEGGFYIISQSEKGLVFEHEFHYYNSFNKVFYER